MRKKITVFAPATVANLSCGFDILGLALDEPGDKVTLTRTDTPGVKITAIHGYEEKIPLDIHKNTAGFAALQFIEKYQPNAGIAIELFKEMPVGSGLGSSAASAVAVLYGMNILFNNDVSKPELLKIAIRAEAVACGAGHADNVSPSLMGGLVLIRSSDPLDVVALPFPDDLYCCVIYPHVEIRTANARKILPKDISLTSAVQQWGNIAGLIAGLYREDYELIARSMQDVIVEPHRARLIPEFERAKQAALDNGALGCGISGSGPSIFTLSRGKTVAVKIGYAIQAIYREARIEHDLYISGVNRQGPRIIKNRQE